MGGAPTWLGRGPQKGTPCLGERTTDDHRSRDPMTGALMTCVHAGRREKKQTQKEQESTGQDAQRERGGGGPKENKRTMHRRGHTARNKQAAGERVGAIGARDKKIEPQASDSG